MSSRFRPDVAAAALAALALLFAAGCGRERRELAVDPVAGQALDNFWELQQGERLFAQMNCAGCHARGGGSMGPALMDSVWVYGRAPDSLFASIAAGRPNGMPGYGRLTDRQVWQLVAYVRRLEGPRTR